MRPVVTERHLDALRDCVQQDIKDRFGIVEVYCDLIDGSLGWIKRVNTGGFNGRLHVCSECPDEKMQQELVSAAVKSIGEGSAYRVQERRGRIDSCPWIGSAT